MIKSFEKLSGLVREQPFAEELLNAAANRSAVEINGAAGSLKALLLALLRRERTTPIVWLFAAAEQTREAKTDIEHLLPVKDSLLFPKSRQSKWGHDDIRVVAQQAEVLQALLEGDAGMLLLPADALSTPVKSKKAIREAAIKANVGDELAFDAFIRKLTEVGFEREPLVEKPGDMAVRGGIVDIFPYTTANPVRVEFWGNVVESIREFELASQRSTLTLSQLRLFPKPQAEPESTTATVLEYVPDDALIVLDDAPAIQKAVLETAGDDPESESTPAWQQYLTQFGTHTVISFSPFRGKFAETRIRVPSQHPKALSGDIKRLAAELQPSNGKPFHNFFLCETQGHANRMRELFADYALGEDQVHVVGMNLSQGFVLPDAAIHVYTDHEFYGRVRRHRGRRKYREGLTLKQLQSLRTGDFVVHADHGVGRFQGLERIKVRDSERECLLIAYRDGDNLYVPLDKMDRVQKYTGKDGGAPVVHKLGSQDWERIKRRTRSRVEDIARELVQLYSMRKAQKGFGYSADTTWQRELEASFQYEDTPDQYKATLDVKSDMEQTEPMDRLVAGDVGYGKTEVAVRAAFKAIQDSRQVAVLVPTTILAEQHFLTFKERYARFPVRVEVISRFRSPKQQKEIIAGLKSGDVDLVIGTHRLLSKDIEFKNLGLLIVDEEHRFGVKHKERLKQLRINVDVLALSATPIPRTLHMSLIGVRDFTQINTPPRDRLPVQTETMEFDPRFIREAILFELQRGGQVFFVHNRVESIHSIAARLADIVPEADIVVAHGQMKESELERVMMDFMNKRFQLLVSTMIIESGLDMPNVNTIFINRADRFGLAQLYQLRGRVGRSNLRAFCYLIVPPLRALSREAVRRLETIEEFTDLGSGIQIAMRDLEIRGAGNILGAAQSGFIEQMGLEMYLKILDDAIKEIRHAASSEKGEDALLAEECRVEVNVDTYLPQTYVEVPSERVDIYRRLAHARAYGEMEAVESEVRDRFGRLPDEARNLFDLAKSRLLGRLAGFRRITCAQNGTEAFFSNTLRETDRAELQQWLMQLTAVDGFEIEFSTDGELSLKLRTPEGESQLAVLLGYLKGAVMKEEARSAETELPARE